ncbi:formin domain containing protein [Acanthamoeba castellanii str. Neff]|uniref:Formin domain containing protein n=1 Tax=Acanthamoeba castellanii (strain ATCC 30010 / Neff) TaxID=1257118 RepID=L8GRW6_ACACF|nr:formin domain containing protein [Acanthamoeba castellanii str. Neff]ELR15924.1 formin domain containing protein [Acanthamoeba castellanii str. Neff]
MFSSRKKDEDKDKDGSRGSVAKKRAEREAINQKLTRLMDALGLAPGDPERDAMLDWSFAKKQRKLEECSKSKIDLDSDVLVMVERLREKKMDVETLDGLCEKLATSSVDWVKNFIKFGGVAWLYECLAFYVYKAGCIRKRKKDVEILELVVACIVEMINNGGSGLKELTSYPDCFRVIVRCLSYISTNKKSLIFELLAAILLLSEDLWKDVTSAVRLYKAVYPQDFHALMEELETGEDLDYKVAFLTFVNTMIVQGQSIKDRVKVREDFMVERITDILAELKSIHADDEDLQEQCIVFDEELENDGAELKNQTMSARKRAEGEEANEDKPIEIITTLWEKIKGSENESTFLSIMHTLLHLGLSLDGGSQDPTLSKKVWGIIDKLLRQFDLMGNASGLTYEHVLAGFMKEARVINASSDDSAAAPAGSLASAAVGISSGKNSKPTTPRDPDRPPMLPWRWNLIPQNQIKDTIFDGLKPMKLIDQGYIDTADLENVFALKSVPKNSNLNVIGVAASGDGKAGAGKVGQAGKKDKKDPTLLDHQRCNIVSIVMHRFPQTPEEIAKSVAELDYKFISLQTMGELRNLFPAKTYEEEKKKLLEYKDDPKNLADAERILHTFFQVPRIREKISVLLFTEEAREKLRDCQESANTVKMALEELRSKRLRQVLEISLAVGNYINNPRQQCHGFRLSSLLKLNDVTSKSKSKFTLLHQIADIVEQKFPELLVFPDELAHLQEAKTAVESLQVETSFIKKDFNLLKTEMELCAKEKNDRWANHLEKYYKDIEKQLTKLGEMEEGFKKDVTYFGERSADDLSSFFSDWDKFTQSFQTAVKYNITVRRKQEAIEKKEAALAKKKELLEKKELAKKKKEEAALKKKKLTKEAKDKKDDKEPKDKSDPLKKEDKKSLLMRNSSKIKDFKSLDVSPPTSPRVEFSKSEADRKVGVTKKTSMLLNDFPKREEVPRKNVVNVSDVDSVVDDFFKSAPVGESNEKGTVKQLVASLRTSTRFSKMRVNRETRHEESVSLTTEQKLVKQVSTRLPKFNLPARD